jgi:DNA-binding PadR family transcriptional regulator
VRDRLRKLKVAPLGIATLALLNEHPMHPYEMFQTLLSRHEDRVVKVRPGSLYHTVARLADDGLVRSAGTDREGNRPERTTYEITDDGRDVLQEQLIDLLATPAEEYPVFPLALTEAHNVEPGLLADLLRRRLLRLRGDLASYEAGLDAVTAKDLHEAYWLDLTYLRDQLAAQVDWLQRTIDRLESGELSWVARDPKNPQTREGTKDLS